MSLITLLGVGDEVFVSATTAANPQLSFIENYDLHQGGTTLGPAVVATLSVRGINIPQSVSVSHGAIQIHYSQGVSSLAAQTISFGLYSLNGSTLSLANSGSATSASAGVGVTHSWMTFNLSATQNISAGMWWFGLMGSSSSTAAGMRGLAFLAAVSINPGNAFPYPLAGRGTASTAALPASIATSNLNFTGNAAVQQPYILLSA